MSETMRAGRFHQAEVRLSVDTIPVPVPGRGQVRIKVRAAGVCLSDVHVIDGSLASPFQPPQVTLGHEVAGEVEAIGEDVLGVAVGDRVLAYLLEDHDGATHTLGNDYDGGWAEYLVIRAADAVPIGPDLPFEQAAIIPDAVSTPWASIVSTAAVRPGESVGAWGVGGLGYHGIKLLRLVGAAPIVGIDPSPIARERALAAGADLVLDPTAASFAEDVRAVTDGRGFDVAFDFAGFTPVRDQALEVLAPKGRLVLVGLTMDDVVIRQSFFLSLYEQRVLGHFGSSIEHVREIVKLVRLGRLDFSDSITDTYPLEEAQTAVDRLISKDGDPIRLVLVP